MKGPKILKAAAALTVLGYCSLLMYQGGVAFTFQETNARVQVPDLAVETVTKTIIDDSEHYKNITLDDIFISVKTSKWYQFTRLPIILKTWYQLAKNQTWFFTDTDNRELTAALITDGHIINTNCSSTHGRESLCCKMSVEYDHYLESSKKWFCHFDDDNYVNVPRLVSVLQNYNHQDDWYLGRNSVHKPLKIQNKLNKNKVYTFMFATGGAGFCISRSLAFKMLPVASGGRFISICDSIRMPDDVTMGFVIEVILQKKLTVVPEFHSHLEQLKLLPVERFRDQISFSYDLWRKKKDNILNVNIVNVPGIDVENDPSRFLSLHCLLFPNTEYCPR